MGTATTMDRAATGSGKSLTEQQLRQLLDRTLRELDEDTKRGPMLRATGLRLRFEFPDVGLLLNVAASEEPGQALSWSFDDVDWEPKLELTMNSDVANGYLQGRESIAIAIARGRVRWRGDSRAALFFLPAARLIVDPYKRIVKRDFPHLAVS